MVTNLQNLWWPRVMTLVLWAVAAASLAGWGLRLGGGLKPGQVAPVAMTAEVAVDPASVARLLGAAEPSAAALVPAAANRFVLLGVVAGRSNTGAALIAVVAGCVSSIMPGALVDAVQGYGELEAQPLIDPFIEVPIALMVHESNRLSRTLEAALDFAQSPEWLTQAEQHGNLFVASRPAAPPPGKP